MKTTFHFGVAALLALLTYREFWRPAQVRTATFVITNTCSGYWTNRAVFPSATEFICVPNTITGLVHVWPDGSTTTSTPTP